MIRLRRVDHLALVCLGVLLACTSDAPSKSQEGQPESSQDGNAADAGGTLSVPTGDLAALCKAYCDHGRAKCGDVAANCEDECRAGDASAGNCSATYRDLISCTATASDISCFEGLFGSGLMCAKEGDADNACPRQPPEESADGGSDTGPDDEPDISGLTPCEAGCKLRGALGCEGFEPLLCEQYCLQRLPEDQDPCLDERKAFDQCNLESDFVCAEDRFPYAPDCEELLDALNECNRP